MEKLYETIKLPPKALILGSGGSARAVRHSLKLHGLSGMTVTRHPNFDDHLTYSELNRHIINEHKLIVNCTPGRHVSKCESVSRNTF